MATSKSTSEPKADPAPEKIQKLKAWRNSTIHLAFAVLQWTVILGVQLACIVIISQSQYSLSHSNEGDRGAESFLESSQSKSILAKGLSDIMIPIFITKPPTTALLTALTIYISSITYMYKLGASSDYQSIFVYVFAILGMYCSIVASWNAGGLGPFKDYMPLFLTIGTALSIPWKFVLARYSQPSNVRKRKFLHED